MTDQASTRRSRSWDTPRFAGDIPGSRLGRASQRALDQGLPHLVDRLDRLGSDSGATEPVGQALVIFNTVTRGFRVAQQGITFIPPFICSTAKYDLRRLEYTMSGVSGEGRKAEIDDSIWSPTREGLTVGIDLTAWHHLDPSRLVHIHQHIGQDYEEKIIRPAVRSMIRLVISEYAVMDD